VTVRVSVPIPLLDRAAITVSSTQSMPVDRFREAP
jgi:hypothetical protein